jgi:D-alanyl-D-alanine carboxypeptidase/D-alanyl-D-alanine-endopeptidase (penicillin-binding protein 4)
VAADSGRGPSAAGVIAQIDDLATAKSLRRSGVVVIDPGTDAVLYDDRARRALIPASSLKILTAAAALEALGPRTRLATTTAVAGDVVYLIGGGDATLARKDDRDSRPDGPATIRRLARETATALGGTTRVDVVFDDSLFTGRQLGPGWAKGFPAAGVAAPVSALMMDQGRKSANSRARVKNPARKTARAFAKYLEKQGVQVRSVEKGVTPGSARELVSVESDTVTEMVQGMLTESDNDVAESLGHLVGSAVVGEGSFAGGARGVTEVLAGAGIDVSGMELFDASGLSGRNRIAPITLAEVLSDVVREERWTALSAGLAVAGVSGTLADRFATKATSAGRGVVRAKTGTLTGVGALAGTVVDTEGRPLVFVVLANRVRSQARARDTMDRLASNLAECGCR